MKVEPTSLGGVLLIEPRRFQDDRGFFMETWRADRYASLGLPAFVQDNLVSSRRGVIRGLHYQWPRPQGKLLQALTGRVLDVAVDIRRGSPTFGSWAAVELSSDNHRQLYIPPGFAHGYAVLSDSALVVYKCTELYVPENDHGLRWNDPQVAVAWPLSDPILSGKDLNAPYLHEIPPEFLPSL